MFQAISLANTLNNNTSKQFPLIFLRLKICLHKSLQVTHGSGQTHYSSVVLYTFFRHFQRKSCTFDYSMQEVKITRTTLQQCALDNLFCIHTAPLFQIQSSKLSKNRHIFNMEIQLHYPMSCYCYSVFLKLNHALTISIMKITFPSILCVRLIHRLCFALLCLRRNSNQQ